MAVDTLGHLLAQHVTPADVQEATGESVELAYVDQGYSGDDPDGDAPLDQGLDRLHVLEGRDRHEKAEEGRAGLPIGGGPSTLASLTSAN